MKYVYVKFNFSNKHTLNEEDLPTQKNMNHMLTEQDSLSSILFSNTQYNMQTYTYMPNFDLLKFI